MSEVLVRFYDGSEFKGDVDDIYIGDVKKLIPTEKLVKHLLTRELANLKGIISVDIRDKL